MKAIRIPLKPHMHFHFGEFKIDNNVALSNTSLFAHSDTLFSALVNVYADVFGNADRFAADFRDGVLKISSLFYYLKKGDYFVYLLPKPVFLDIFSPRDGNHKLRNKIKFLSKGVWEKGFVASDWINGTEYRLIQNQDILFTREEYEKLGLNEDDSVFTIVDIPKNPIRVKTQGSKNESDESIYYQSDVEIAEIEGVELGFYFVFEVVPEFKTEELLKVLNVLSLSGIGGEKTNTGLAMRPPEIVDFILNVTGESSMLSGFTNISLLNPGDRQDLENVVYSQTVLRGGARYTGNLPLKVVRMIREGALLKVDSVSGRLVETGMDFQGHAVLRNGKPFVLPIKYISSYE